MKFSSYFGEKRVFHIAEPKEIKGGKLTDVYFVRTMEVLKAKKIDKWVKAEFIAKRFPEDYGWGVLAGVEEAACLLKDLKVSVRAMREGTIFRAFEPDMEIEGMCTDFGLYETSLPGADRCPCGGRFKELLIPFIQDRKILWDLPRPQAIREYVLEQLPHYDL